MIPRVKNIWITIPTILLCFEPTISVTGRKQTQEIREVLSIKANRLDTCLKKISYQHYWNVLEHEDMEASACAEVLEMAFPVPYMHFLCPYPQDPKPTPSGYD